MNAFFDGMALAVAAILVGVFGAMGVFWLYDHVPYLPYALLAGFLGISIWRWSVWIRRILARRNRA